MSNKRPLNEDDGGDTALPPAKKLKTSGPIEQKLIFENKKFWIAKSFAPKNEWYTLIPAHGGTILGEREQEAIMEDFDDQEFFYLTNWSSLGEYFAIREVETATIVDTHALDTAITTNQMPTQVCTNHQFLTFFVHFFMTCFVLFHRIVHHHIHYNHNYLKIMYDLKD